MRCARCGCKPLPVEADLMQWGGSCRGCWASVLREDLQHARGTLRELAHTLDETERYAEMPEDLVAEVTALVAPLKDLP